MTEPTLYIGVGHAMRRDDGVGPWLAEELAKRGQRAATHEGDGAALMALFEGEERVTLLDATQSGAAPGTLIRIEADREPLPASFFRNSTHEFGLAEAVETARSLGTLPPWVHVYGIEGEEFGFGEGLTPKVAEAARQLLDRLACPTHP